MESLARQPVESIGSDFASFVRQGYLDNGIIFGCINARLTLFAQGVFKLRRRADNELRDLPPRMRLLEEPWPGGTTAEMFARIEQDTSLAGNWYLYQAEPNQLQRLRPDWVDIVLDPQGAERVGYLYHRGGRLADPAGIPLTLDEVAHGSPYPDPMAAFRGTSWISSVVVEIQSDKAMTRHKREFFANAATPNLLVKLQQSLTEPQRKRWRDMLQATFGGTGNAWKTMVLEEGADATVIGKAVELGFADTQAGGENRIAVAAGVPSVVLGIKEGAEQATYSNYGQALAHMANFTTQHMWNDTAAVLAQLVSVPEGADLVVDTSEIPALQRDLKEAAEVEKTQAETMKLLLDANFDAESVVEAVTGGDLTLLVPAEEAELGGNGEVEESALDGLLGAIDV